MARGRRVRPRRKGVFIVNKSASARRAAKALYGRTGERKSTKRRAASARSR